jgi:predicted RNA-binding Zn ribbon-like protein
VVDELQQYRFERSDLVGGHVVLDLVNTVTGRDSRPTDWLATYERLLEWAALTDAFEARSLSMLARMCAAEARGAARALRRVRELREAVSEIIVATIEGKPTPNRALAEMERQLKDAVGASCLTFSDGCAALEIDVASSRLDYPRHILALSAFDLLRAFPAQRVRQCSAPRCTSIFIDSSRGGQRRWCDMATCGNRAKSRRHYERRRVAR